MKNDIRKLVEELTFYNTAYRSGQPVIQDHEYDRLVEDLKALDPDHPFLSIVEPELFGGKEKVRHPNPMLSTEKAYTKEQLERFVNRVTKEAALVGVSDPVFKVTAKLDGLAGRDDGKVFASRGNGEVGYEISNAFQKGVIPKGGRGLGAGEIVAVKTYFEEKMAFFFEHPRNMVVGIVSSDTLNENAKRALDDQMVHFVPYDTLAFWQGSGKELLEQTRTIVDGILKQVDYPTDGVVAEAIDQRVKDKMGATAHHYRWQIAIKSKGETAQTLVRDITWQVGRTGNITPVLNVEPVFLSGATIKRVTAHHAGNIKSLNIGVGTKIRIIRSGEVIPKLEAVLEAIGDIVLPDHCPSCGAPLEWKNDFLKCLRYTCPAQVEQRISHWFKILGSADWFGIQTIKKLVKNGFDTLEKIYAMTSDDFSSLGFGPVQSQNLADAINRSLEQPVEDWRFLAAFGIPDLGTGDSRKLLSYIPIDRILEVDSDQIRIIKGFGEKTSRSIEAGIQRIRNLMSHMFDLKFHLNRTPLAADMEDAKGPLVGKAVVFTGKMISGSRKKMQEEARTLGARVQTAVSSATDILVCGENVGKKKIEKAEKLGITILTEDVYLNLIF